MDLSVYNMFSGNIYPYSRHFPISLTIQIRLKNRGKNRNLTSLKHRIKVSMKKYIM